MRQPCTVTRHFTISMESSILPVANEFLAEPIICENGFLRVPDKPGLGLVFDEDKLRKYSDNTR